MKNFILVVAIMGCCLFVEGQNRFRFDLSLLGGSSKNNSKSLGSIVGLGGGEFYQPLQYLPILMGLSAEVEKCDKLKGLNYPVYYSVAYYGNRQAIAPIGSVSLGYNIYDNVDDQSNRDQITTMKGGFYTGMNGGFSFNKWRSAPYVMIGVANMTFNTTVLTKISSVSNRERSNNTELFFRFGFSFK